MWQLSSQAIFESVSESTEKLIHKCGLIEMECDKNIHVEGIVIESQI